MVGKGSPRLSMLARGSPKLGRMLAATSSAIKKRTASSPKAKQRQQRANWNPDLEQSLIEILLENKDNRGDNGWSTEVWNNMVKEFHKRNTYACYTKLQLQEKEGQLKRDYKMLKAARGQSGSAWNEKRSMVEGSPHLWDKLEVSFPKISKFRKPHARFPLYDACGELYDGHIAEGTHNLTSNEPTEEEQTLMQVQDVDETEESDDVLVLGGTNTSGEAAADDEHNLQGRPADVDGETSASAERRALQRLTAARAEKEPKKSKKNSNVESMMERYLEMRSKQVEAESTQLAKEKDQADGADFSVKKCISALSLMDVTKQEKAKAYAVFKKAENREVFLCACDDDPESALIWLRSEMS